MKRAWYHAVRRSDGHSEVIAADPRFAAGFDEAAYPPAEWEVTKLSREPGEHDRIEPGGKVVRCKVKKAESERRRRAEGLSRVELVDMIDGLGARVKALEKIIAERGVSIAAAKVKEGRVG